MKKSKLFLLGILITGMAFGLVLAGCDTGDNGLTAEELADQLAADINAIKPGSAEVDGAMVTLSGGLSLESQFTVPAGVTLDVTGDGELGLLDATLTVNGTVNANSNRVRLEDNASWGTINGSGTIQLKGTGSLLNIRRSNNVANRTLTLDGVTLVGVADNYDPLVRVNEGCEFVMKSGKIRGNTRVRDGTISAGGVRIDGEGATFTMSGGEISGNTVKAGDHASGGGVWIGERSVFTMSGGEISGNTAAGINPNRNGQGGGVEVNGAFTMSGGKISGNTVEGDEYSGGGGVRLGEGASFTMTGGEISDNSVSTANTGSTGGGVKLENGATFTMKAGTIMGNTAASNDWSEGGGVKLENGTTFIMEGGTISGNTASGKQRSAGGGVRVNQESVFTMSGGTISGNITEGDSYGGGVEVWRGTFTMEGGTISGNTARIGGGVRLVSESPTFTMSGGTIYGKVGSLPAGSDAKLANIAQNGDGGAALNVSNGTAKWGTGGTYTKGGASQSGGTDIGSTDDTLIAVPAQ
jgi:hypothetical protein